MLPSFGALVGTSLPMRRLFALLDKIAQSDINVLIEGESGTGKELVATEIVQRSARADKPFVVVDCGAIAPSLVESELFGHVRGAFTGADRDRDGRLRGGRRRHALPRRDRRAAARAPAEAPPRARGARDPPRRRDRARDASTCASSPRRTATSSARSTRGASARTSTSASRSSACACRRSASASTTSRSSFARSSQQLGVPRGGAPLPAAGARARCRSTTGRATCASSATTSSAASCSSRRASTLAARSGRRRCRRAGGRQRDRPRSCPSASRRTRVIDVFERATSSQLLEACGRQHEQGGAHGRHGPHVPPPPRAEARAPRRSRAGPPSGDHADEHPSMSRRPMRRRGRQR